MLCAVTHCTGSIRSIQDLCWGNQEMRTCTLAESNPLCHLILALTLEYSLPQSWREWNWSFWNHCPGWCSKSEPELESTEVSNYFCPQTNLQANVLCSLTHLALVKFVSLWSLWITVTSPTCVLISIILKYHTCWPIRLVVHFLKVKYQRSVIVTWLVNALCVVT